MAETGDILEELHATASKALASGGRDGASAPELVERLEALVSAASEAGHSIEEIAVAAHLSYHHVCALAGVAPPEPDRTSDGRQTWRLDLG
ncbi:hypothetical protein [Demequina soli]|uniref:hypothetical protein n=1 Tax=Demequina soli TaxID=1638987 RepID=UPI000784E9C4|nr:hypothetical protein [Demequina soli]